MPLPDSVRWRIQRAAANGETLTAEERVEVVKLLTEEYPEMRLDQKYVGPVLTMTVKLRRGGRRGPPQKFTDQMIADALAASGGNGRKAAKLLGCSYQTVYLRRKRL